MGSSKAWVAPEGRVGNGGLWCVLSVLCGIGCVLRPGSIPALRALRWQRPKRIACSAGGPCWTLNSWNEGPGNGTNDVERNQGRSGTERRVPQLSCARGSELQQGERRILAGPAAGVRSQGLPARSGGRELASSTWTGWGDHSRRRSPRHQFVLFLRNGRRRPSTGGLRLGHPR